MKWFGRTSQKVSLSQYSIQLPTIAAFSSSSNSLSIHPKMERSPVCAFIELHHSSLASVKLFIFHFAILGKKQMGFPVRNPDVCGRLCAPFDIKCIPKHRKLVPVQAERTVAVVGSSYSRFLFPVMKNGGGMKRAVTESWRSWRLYRYRARKP